MSQLELCILALGLSLDAFAVAIASGIILKKPAWPQVFKIAAAFGFFQFLMPLLGWLAGLTLKAFITSIDHWIAFILLSGIGGKMIADSLHPCEHRKINPLEWKTLLALAVATSVDALAAGIGFAFLSIHIFSAVIFIGLWTFFLSAVGVKVGYRLGCLFEKWVHLTGGLILIIIGTNILIRHLSGL